MKKITVLILIIILSGCFGFSRFNNSKRNNSYNIPKNFTDTSKTHLNLTFNATKSDYERGLFVLKKYSPDGYYIIYHDIYLSRPRRGSSAYRQLIPFKDRGFLRYNVLVHESNHKYASQYLQSMIRNKRISSFPRFLGYESIYINNGFTIFVKRTKTFPSARINSIYPDYIKKMNKEKPRFKTYVYPSIRTQSTQVYGIYGLLDEFNSYFQGTRTAYDLLPYYQTKKDVIKSLSVYFQSYYGTFFAHGEFKLFILQYLILAEKQYPQVFKGIINNKNFIKAFLTVDREYLLLHKRFNSRKKKLKVWFRLQGYELKVTETYDKIVKRINKNQRISTGTYNYYPYYNVFINELKKPEYSRMMKLLLSKEKQI